MSPDVIRESSSVKIICETPAGVLVNQCNFYINSEDKNIKVSSSCELNLTGAEVFRWASVKSPESLNIYCYYTTNMRGSSISSSDSDPATVKVGEIFHCCSSVLETVIAVFLLTMYYFTLIDLRNPSPVSDDDDDSPIGHFWTGWILFIKTLSIDCKSTYYYLEGTFYYS